MSFFVFTGLDGSGKTTTLNLLEEKFGHQAAFLRVPTTQPEKYQDDPQLQAVCEMINAFGHEADSRGIPGLKIIAMFGAMLLFDDMYTHLSKDKPNYIFAERHPWIDTAVYGRAYHKVMDPELVPTEIHQSFSKNYASELKVLIEKLPENDFNHKEATFYILAFLHDWFQDEAHFSFHGLQKLFNPPRPKALYFLDAPPHVLANRLAGRSQKEYHESEAMLSKMRPLYLQIFKDADFKSNIVNTEGWEEVNQLLTQF